MLPPKKLVVFGTICGVVSFFLIGAFLLNLVFPGKVSLTDAQKKEIFANIIKNNSGNLSSRNAVAAESLSVSADATTLSAPLIYRPDPQDYNYRESTTTYSDGPAIEQCAYFNSIEGGGYYTTKSFEFYGDGSYNSKYIYTDSDGDLTTYSLTNTNENSSNHIEYRGGSYGVKWDYNLAILSGRKTLESGAAISDSAPADGGTSDLPASSPVEPGSEVPPENNVVPEPEIDYDALILQYFGPDADIVDVLNQNGRRYYVVQYSYTVDCSQEIVILRDVASSLQDASNESTIVVQNVVDSETFEYVKSSNYLNSATANNLLNSYTTSTQTQNTTLDAVASNFEFEYDVEVKTIETDDYNAENEAQNLLDYLSDQAYTLVLVENSDATLQSAYSYEASVRSNSTANYTSDRNFYPSGAKGDAMYADYIESTGFDKLPLFNATYVFNLDSTYDSVNIETYSQDVDVKSNLSLENSETSPINITVDSQNVEGTLYTYTYKALVEPDSTVSNDDGEVVDPLPPEREYSTRQLYLEMNGFKYVITLPTRSDFDLNTLRFETIETLNSSQMNEFGAEIIKVYVDNSGSGSVGITDPAKPL